MKKVSGGKAAVASLLTEKVERIGELGEAVQAALDSGRPAVIDIAIDPEALYSFRCDSFKHRGG
jgi:acetolactate synthase-1/2/3 large subunit/sulfoacetaldehyde acetyltransferase